jgi:hypothetical protein
MHARNRKRHLITGLCGGTRLADHEVDQAFSQSLRQASLEEVRELNGEALTLQRRVTELQQMIKEDQARIAALSASGGVAAAESGAADDFKVANAQLGLDQDELSDSMADLARESGDQRVKIQQELSSREAVMKKYDAQAAGAAGQTAMTSAEQYSTLAGQLAEWWAQRSRKQLIQQTEQLARADVAALTADHSRLEAEAKAAEGNAAMVKSAEQSSPDRVKQLQRMAVRRNIVSILNDRLGAQQQLVALYLKWGKQVELQHKIVLHLILQSLISIVTILLVVVLGGWALPTALDRMWQAAGRSRPCERF